MSSSIDILEKLISFNTESSLSNKSMLLWIKKYLDENNVTNGLIEQPGGEDKANLWARLGPDKKEGIVLSGHSDVVPADKDDWQSNPFSLQQKGNRLYGRGTTDMKGFLAAVLSRIPQIDQSKLSRPIWLSFSCDEETGCYGVPHLIKKFSEMAIEPYAVIVGEPSEMKVISGHKSLHCIKTVVKGLPGHSSDPRKGKSAIQAACRAVIHLDEIMQKSHQNNNYDPNYTTIHTGEISGGTRINIIAYECEFNWDMRCIPEDDPNRILDDFAIWCRENSFMSDFQLTSEVLYHQPAFHHDSDSTAESLARQLSGDNQQCFASYLTEAGQFQEAGFPVIVCGPGSIEQAHIIDEFLERDQLEKAEIFLNDLIEFCYR